MKTFYLEVRAQKWEGSVSNPNSMKPIGRYYYRPPFRVTEDEISIHAHSSRFDHQAIKNLLVGDVYCDRRGDRWTRTA
ncbi:hypothetical protein 20Sep420_00025 [Pseudomonas phage 20Sep420]|nr:hypothetical protein 20Sep420_00025 [Pseudomonas phage 20Sep420]